jgi:glycosyltransferase involved in cell wall biosynthesis
LTYVGGRSSSYEWINEEVRRAETEDIGFTWVTDASDEDVARLIDECDVLVSFGTEGYGIPALEAIRRGKPVLFGGIQPAAQLMEGRGSTNVGDPTVDSIKKAFVEYSRTGELLRLRRSCDPAAIPTWRAFARSVVEGTMRTV